MISFFTACQKILTSRSLCSGKIDDVCKYCDVSLGGKVFACQCGGLGLEHVAFLGLGKSLYSLSVFLLCRWISTDKGDTQMKASPTRMAPCTATRFKHFTARMGPPGSHGATGYWEGMLCSTGLDIKGLMLGLERRGDKNNVDFSVLGRFDACFRGDKMVCIVIDGYHVGLLCGFILPVKWDDGKDRLPLSSRQKRKHHRKVAQQPPHRHQAPFLKATQAFSIQKSSPLPPGQKVSQNGHFLCGPL